MPAQAIAEQREQRGLVERGEPLDPIAIAPRGQRHIVGEPPRTIAIGPATAIIERLRQVPMIEADPRLDVGRQQRIDQTVVEGQARLIGRAAAGR